MIFIFLAICGFLFWLDRLYTKRERELRRLEHELWQLDARERCLEAEGFTLIEDWLPEPDETVELLRAEGGIKVHSVMPISKGDSSSWGWLKLNNHFTHWRHCEWKP